MEALTMVVALWVAAGCGKSEEECLQVRGQAFELINSPHTCNDDTNCMFSVWPGCAKPVNKRNDATLAKLKEESDNGGCIDEASTCREPPDVYCKQGLCVFRERPGGTQNPTQ
jgi:hypothetical protein